MRYRISLANFYTTSYHCHLIFLHIANFHLSHLTSPSSCFLTPAPCQRLDTQNQQG